MNFKYKLFFFAVCSLDVSFCQTEVNGTLNSRREILEQQARNAYQNACLRLQELSNWMSVVFKIKGVWASSAVNELASKSGEIRNETDRSNLPSLPPRPKIIGSQCSMKSMQVTAQTYTYLQSQLLLLKMFLGRNIARSSKAKLDNANVSLRERMKVVETFNTTLNNILYKLKQGTQEISAQVNSESWKSGILIQDIQDGGLLQHLQSPRSLPENIQDGNVRNSSEITRSRSRTFFQNLGKALDRIIFPPFDRKLNVVTSDGNA